MFEISPLAVEISYFSLLSSSSTAIIFGVKVKLAASKLTSSTTSNVKSNDKDSSFNEISSK
jgi:hypothetical protein